MKFISKIIAVLFIVSSIGTTAALAQGNEQSPEPTCQCQEQGTVLSGTELTQALDQAIANSDVQTAITNYRDQGYVLELNQSGAATKNNQTVTGLSLVKDGAEFAYIFFNNTTEQVNSFDQTQAESWTDPNTVQPFVLCSQCLITCIAMISVPALFIPCMALCGGGFC